MIPSDTLPASVRNGAFCLFVAVLASVALFLSAGVNPSPAAAAISQQTITFNNTSVVNARLNGQYPARLVNWGTGVWFVSGATGKFRTRNLRFNRRSATRGSFAFRVPRRVISIAAFNRGARATKVSLSCSGQRVASARVRAKAVRTLRTGWNANCSPVAISAGNGQATRFDNLVVDDASVVPPNIATVTIPVTPVAPTPPVAANKPAPASYWIPPANTSWDWQLATPIDPSADVMMYDIDMFANDASVIASLHAQGRKVICYVSVGSWENWRPDAASFPATVRGSVYKGFPDERWLDIRAWNILGPIMTARFTLAKSKGCDGIEPDNVDGYDTTAHESSGFPLTYDDQIAYNTQIANLAHSLGMSIGLKNDINQAQALEPVFDWALSEECFQYNECSFFAPFTQAGKAVFEVEYNLAPSAFCPQANALNLNALQKNNALDAFRVACR